jgi:hypothetical protein
MSVCAPCSPPAAPAEVDGSGWVPLPVLISQLKTKPSEADVRAIVAADEKVRGLALTRLERKGTSRRPVPQAGRA